MAFHRITVFFLLVLLVPNGQAQGVATSWKDIVRNEDAAWFGSRQAGEMAANVLLFQRDIGGWPKNIQIQQPLSEKEKKELLLLKADPAGCTIDNGATTMELLFLSKVYRQDPQEKYRMAFLKGIEYLLEAQYENGGWPQFFPLENKYSSHITFNDDAMVNAIETLREIKDGTDYFSIKASEKTRKKAAIAFQKGIDCILKTQFNQDGTLTAWCAQHDEYSLFPAQARKYELPSLSGYESAGIVLLLMEEPNPSRELKRAINSAVSWFEKTKITNLKEVSVYDSKGTVKDKKMVPSREEQPIWARFMELENNRPFFADRDGIKKDSMAHIGSERRNGYAWYTSAPRAVLEQYPAWRKQNRTENKKSASTFTVALDGSGDFTSIQEAINQCQSFPYAPIVIFIKEGVYKEKIKVHEWNPNLHLVGENREKTIITFEDHFTKIDLGRNSTFFTSTVLVEANDVLLKNLTIANASGDVGQAIALSVTSTRVAVVNCRLLGNQDTLYASGIGKQLYKDCYMEGTVDFIFGSATAWFENCELHSKGDSFVTAASTPKGAEFGFVFNKCRLTASEKATKVYLGRPWRIYARTVFLNADLGKHIVPEGWHNWSKPEAEQSSFYAEFQSTGEGARVEARVKWSHQLSKREARKYTIQNILGTGSHSKTQWYENL